VAFANAGIDSGPWGSSALGPAPIRPRVEGALERYTDERWNRVIDVNLNGSSRRRAPRPHDASRRFRRYHRDDVAGGNKVESVVGSHDGARRAQSTSCTASR
jgi:hypothetical protein